MTTFALMSMFVVASVWLNGCCSSSPTEPSASSTVLNGIVPGGGLVFHDLVVPSRTDSVDAHVHWTPDAQLQLIQVDPYCDPTQDSTCRWLTDPYGPTPDSSREIWGFGNHQGSDATGRVRFVLRNLTPNIAATYRMTLTPQRHGTNC
jgi:hypothetical protein